MRVAFTKGSGKYDKMTAVRHDGSIETLDCPKQRIIPHDMVHYAVESYLRKSGFLSRVKSGERADFEMKGNAESDGVERLVEVFQGDAWSGGNSSLEDMIAMYQVTCQERGCEMLPVSADDLAAIRDHIEQLEEQWQGLAVGETLVLEL